MDETPVHLDVNFRSFVHVYCIPIVEIIEQFPEIERLFLSLHYAAGNRH